MDSDSNSIESSLYSLPRTAENLNPYTAQRINANNNSNKGGRYPTPNIGEFNMDFDGLDVDVRELAQHHPQGFNTFDKDAPINNLPPEVLLLIFSQISHKPHLVPLLTVCKKWGDLVVELLWFRPTLMDKKAVEGIRRIMSLDRRQTYWDYRSYIRRLNLSFVVERVNDEFLELFEGCVNLERLTLVNCSSLSHGPIVKILQGCSKLQSVDMTGVRDITDDIFNALAENSPRLQGLYAPQCPSITNDAFLNIVNNCSMLKRVKVSDCQNITDQSIIELTDKCKSLIEVDVHNCTEITDASLQQLFTNLEQLREFRISQNTNVSDNIFRAIPETLILERLRILDFTGCIRITDRSVERIVQCAPRLRNVILSKCLSITDASLRALSMLGKNLHYIHLGHCSNITDNGVVTLIRNCHRLQYIDLACCTQLTNISVVELASLPRLRRIGLVKCSNINDYGLLAMIGRRGLDDTLERVHLSYCTNLSIYPIMQLLRSCPRLTHLSLTGINEFLRPDITEFCRSPPPDFNEHQKKLFCVFSGQGVKRLRDYLLNSENVAAMNVDRRILINDRMNGLVQADQFRNHDLLLGRAQNQRFQALFQEQLQHQQFAQFAQQPQPNLQQPPPLLVGEPQQVLLPALNLNPLAGAAADADDEDEIMDESD